LDQAAPVPTEAAPEFRVFEEALDRRAETGFIIPD